MEAIGISLSTIALTSLLSTCIECFEYIDTAKTCERDLACLATRFTIEKVRLQVWGDSVGLKGSTVRCSQFESPHFRPIIEHNLNCIRLLLRTPSL